MVAVTITTELIALIFAYVVVYVLAYKKNNTFGNLIFLGLGATSYLLINIHPSTSFILVMIPLISMAYDFLHKPIEKKY